LISKTHRRASLISCGDPSGVPLGDAFTSEGTNTTLSIATPQVQEDITYRIRATKRSVGSTVPAQAFHFLDESAPVKVGIDADLVVEIVAKPLDPANEKPQPADPRIVPYGGSADVRIYKSQEGVQYSLIIGKVGMTQFITGDLHDVVLSTGPMLEDAVIQVSATKTFLASENKASDTSTLSATRLLAVRANPALAVSVDPSPILDYQQDAAIKIAHTQSSAKYRAHARTIRDVEFVRDPTDGQCRHRPRSRAAGCATTADTGSLGRARWLRAAR